MTRQLGWPPNFTEAEFNRRGLSPIAPQHRGNMLALAWVLQTLRNTVFEGRAITVTSAYRTPADYDRLVRAGYKPARNGYHFDGLAVDFVVAGLTPAQVQQRLRTARWYGGLGTGKTFTHIDLGPQREFDY